jgi:hypothetical protein
LIHLRHAELEVALRLDAMRRREGSDQSVGVQEDAFGRDAVGS